MPDLHHQVDFFSADVVAVSFEDVGMVTEHVNFDLVD